jgi:prolyl-tRNA synthetase
MEKTAIVPTREVNYPEWYQQVIIAADLAENSPVRGCMVIKPWGYAIWEQIQMELDKKLKQTEHVNAYFPLLIPLSLLEKEAAHVEGFAKECAVVTHHRLVATESGNLIPDGKLEEPLVIRPTSETIIGEMYAKWIKSYRDLPVKINQWANIMRWEMRTRLFLRTSEFLWQEGHTAHATKAEAIDETLQILDIYTSLVEDYLAMPVIKGEKPCFERFPGAVNTYCIEAMMQDKKALQAGTSHFLGQNFSQAAKIQFASKDGELEHAWTTSWGVTTRLIGSLIMIHSDDNGLVLPPKIAPQQVVIIPIYKNEEEQQQVLDYCTKLNEKLNNINYANTKVRSFIDKRDLRGGDKAWQWIKKGVPIRLEIGARDIANDAVFMGRRDLPPKQKQTLKVNEFIEQLAGILDLIQTTMLDKARTFMQENIVNIDNLNDFNQFFTEDQLISRGFVSCYAIDDAQIEKFIKPLKVTARCMPLQHNDTPGTCIFTGKVANKKMIFAKAY